MPAMLSTREAATASVTASAARRRTSPMSPDPTTRAITDEVPAMRPIPRLVITMMIGKVKLIAARASEPNCATNQVSVTLKSIMPRIAHTMGTVMDTRCPATGPSVRRAGLLVIADADAT